MECEKNYAITFVRIYIIHFLFFKFYDNLESVIEVMVVSDAFPLTTVNLREYPIYMILLNPLQFF